MSKITTERNQKTLLELVTKPGNDICADCKARTPRWASHNLGIFICLNCASIHRKIGTHVTKVKSLTMDAWSKEQVETMKSMGNLKSNAIYNPNEVRHPPPPNLMDVERDSELEAYIRSKYEFKRFLNKSSRTGSKLGPSISSPSISTNGNSRSVHGPPTSTSSASIPSSSQSQILSQRYAATTTPAAPTTQTQTASQSSSSISEQRQQQQPKQLTAPPATNERSQADDHVWADLASLQAPALNSSLPLQIQASTQQSLTFQQPSFTGNPSAYQMGIGGGVPQFQQGNPYAQQAFSATATGVTTPSFSAGSIGSYAPVTPFTQQLPNYFTTNHSQFPMPTSVLGHMGQSQYNVLQQPQHQPQQGGALQIHVPVPSNIGQQAGFMSTPPLPSSFGSNPGVGVAGTQRPFLSATTPQPMLTSTTPQSMLSTTPQLQNPSASSGSQQMGMGMGMRMMPGMPQGSPFLSTTPQPQQQMPPFYYMGPGAAPVGGVQQPQMQMPMGPYGGGFQGQVQGQLMSTPFGTGGFNTGGQQWGAL